MLSDPELSPSPTEPVEFYNTTHKSFSFDLTVYLDQYSLFRTFACMFILKNNSSQELVLLNPFMTSITQLPSKIESNCAEAPSKLHDLVHNINRLSDVYVTSSSTIVLRFSSLDYLVWTKPGDGSWVYAEFKVMCSSNVLFCEDRILTIDPYRGLMQINFANEMPSQPQVEVVIPHRKLPDLDDARYLIDCGGNIFLVSFMLDDADEQNFWESFEMYKLNLKKKKSVGSSNLGNHSIFSVRIEHSQYLVRRVSFQQILFTSAVNTMVKPPFTI